MTQTIKAHFGGKGIVPDEPVQLPVGQALRVRPEVPGTAGTPSRVNWSEPLYDPE